MSKTTSRVDQFRTEAVKPLYAAAGATELAVDLARGYANEAQQKAQKSAQERLSAVQARVSSVQRDPKVLQNQARDAQNRFESRLAELQKDARDFPGRVQGQLAEALDELVSTYADLADRGEKFVAALRKDGVKAVTAVKKAPSQSTTLRRERAVVASKTAKPATRKPAAKKPAAKKTTGTTTATKTTATKTTTA